MAESSSVLPLVAILIVVIVLVIFLVHRLRWRRGARNRGGPRLLLCLLLRLLLLPLLLLLLLVLASRWHLNRLGLDARLLGRRLHGLQLVEHRSLRWPRLLPLLLLLHRGA
jgi:flagellar biogenesis protein FliO